MNISLARICKAIGWSVFGAALLLMVPNVATGQSDVPTNTQSLGKNAQVDPAKRAWLGFVLQDTKHRGSRIVGLYPGGPAARAGLRVGDFVLSVDKEEVATSEDTIAAINHAVPHQQVTLVVLRRGRQHEFRVTAGSRAEYEQVMEDVQRASQCRQIPLPARPLYGCQTGYYCPPGSGYVPGYYYYYQWGPFYRWYYYPSPYARVPLSVPSPVY